MLKAAIDLGTHTGRLIIAEVIDGELRQTILKKTKIIALGEDTSRTGKISPAALQRAVALLNDFTSEIESSGAELVKAVTTNAVRIASNKFEVVSQIREHTGIDIEIISGVAEAEYGSRGIRSAFGNESFISFDIGGGSTEFSFVNQGKPATVISLPLGAVNLTEEFVHSDPISDADFNNLTRETEMRLVPELSGCKGAASLLIGIAGTVTNLAAIKLKMAKYDPRLVHKTCLSYPEIDDMIYSFRRLSLADRRQITGLEPERAPFILAGTVLIKSILNALQLQVVTVSEAGLLEGLIEKFG